MNRVDAVTLVDTMSIYHVRAYGCLFAAVVTVVVVSAWDGLAVVDLVPARPLWLVVISTLIPVVLAGVSVHFSLLAAAEKNNLRKALTSQE